MPYKHIEMLKLKVSIYFLLIFKICDAKRIYPDNPFLSKVDLTNEQVRNSMYGNNPFLTSNLPSFAPRILEVSDNGIPKYTKNQFLPQMKKSISEICGVSMVPLMRGGDDVQPGEYPWLGALFINMNYDPNQIRYICTVNLVTSKHVLTAGHCVYPNQDPVLYTIVLGAIKKDIQRKYIKVTKLDVHPNYQQNQASHDIAVLTLESPVVFENGLKPICLWSFDAENTVQHNDGILAGFGPDYSHCRKIKYPIVSSDRCRASHVSFHNLTSNSTFCAGTRDNRGPCFGDSGAGFMQFVNGRYHMRGVVSHSLGENGDCNLREYIIFAKIYPTLEWIKEKLGDGLN